MATRKSTQAAPAASVNDYSSPSTCSPSTLYKNAISLLDELYDEQETILCVALAGANNASEDAVCEMRLFNVIRKMAEGTELLDGLRKDIMRLAREAGVETIEVQS
jgi:hypothetical protein